MEIYDFDPNGLPAPLLAALGRLAVASSQTEDIVNMAAITLMAVDDRIGLATLAQLSLGNRLSALRSLAALRIEDGPLLEKINAAASDIEKSIEVRNRYLHGGWGRVRATGQTVFTKFIARRELRATVEFIDAAQVEVAARAVLDAGLALVVVMRGYRRPVG